MVFFATGVLAAFVQTGVAAVAAAGMVGAAASLGVATVRAAPACDVGKPQDAVNGWNSSDCEVPTARVARSRSRSATLRASSFFISASWISRRPKVTAEGFAFFTSSSVAQGALGSAVGVVVEAGVGAGDGGLMGAGTTTGTDFGMVGEGACSAEGLRFFCEGRLGSTDASGAAEIVGSVIIGSAGTGSGTVASAAG